jgi:hypothetical protein
MGQHKIDEITCSSFAQGCLGSLLVRHAVRLSAGIASAGFAPHRSSGPIYDGGWHVLQVCLDKDAGVAQPEITGSSGRGSSEVTP